MTNDSRPLCSCKNSQLSVYMYVRTDVRRRKRFLDFTNSFVSRSIYFSFASFFSFFFFLLILFFFLFLFPPLSPSIFVSALWNGEGREEAIERDSVTFSIRGGKF